MRIGSKMRVFRVTDYSNPELVARKRRLDQYFRLAELHKQYRQTFPLTAPGAAGCH